MDRRIAPSLGTKSALRIDRCELRGCTLDGLAGIERLRLGWTDGLDFKPRPRWPLEEGARP